MFVCCLWVEQALVNVACLSCLFTAIIVRIIRVRSSMFQSVRMYESSEDETSLTRTAAL